MKTDGARGHGKFFVHQKKVNMKITGLGDIFIICLILRLGGTGSEADNNS